MTNTTVKPLSTKQLAISAALTGHGMHSTRINGVLHALVPYVNWDGCKGVEWVRCETWGQLLEVLGY